MAKTLVEVLTEQGVETKESSNDRRVASCPFHEGDRDPSFVVYPNETYYCFGCHVWGNPVKFLVDYKGMTSQEALDYVGHDYKLPKAEKRVIKVKNMAWTSQFLYNVAMQYHNYLLRNEGPVEYLLQRGLTRKTISKFMIGYTDGAVLDMQFAQDYEMANEVGLLSKDGYETLSHRITIPNIIEDKHCDFMIGRTVINDKLKYLGLRMPKPIMGFHEVRHSPIIFLVEGQFDWLLLRQWEYPAVVMSGSHLTRVNASLLKNKQLIYIPDNDATGMKAANEVKRQLPSTLILDTSSFNTKDLSEAATNTDAIARETFDRLVREQVWPILSSTPIYEKWLPISPDFQPLQLT